MQHGSMYCITQHDGSGDIPIQYALVFGSSYSLKSTCRPVWYLLQYLAAGIGFARPRVVVG